MGLLHKDRFVCLDCETTGLDTKKDHIIEIAAVRFTFESILETKETLINPGVQIPEESIAIHNITQDMVADKPRVQEVLPELLKFVGEDIIVGHGIGFDLSIIYETAQKYNIPTRIHKNAYIDTLRLARLYGESAINSLEHLRKHFNIEYHGAHRAMNDVLVNIKVFKHLAHNFKTTKDLLKRLEKPILLKSMPLGKHKGRSFRDIPVEYLRWAIKQDFDQDLMHSLRTELKLRKKGDTFLSSSNPFSSL